MQRQRNGLKPWLGWLAICLGISAGPSLAGTFGGFDARTAAMAGVGVVTGARYASFNNPALLTSADEVHEWFLLAPTLSSSEGDGDKLKDNLDAFQEAASGSDLNAIRSGLSAMQDAQYRSSTQSALLLSVPSRILSGAAFVNVYEWHTAEANIDGGDLGQALPITYGSNLKIRGVRILENGVSAAKVYDFGRGWFRDISIGLNVKFMFIEGYGYDDPIETAKLTLDQAERRNGSIINLDTGFFKEVGVWKMGLVAKNLLIDEFEMGNSGETIKMDPQVRAGFAYQNRRTVMEVNLDLTENKQIGYDALTQELALGWEHMPAHWLALRAGYRQNLQGTKKGLAAGGIGLIMGGVHFDVSGYGGEERTGIAAQLGFQF